ncbi:MAG: exodeoxyribonuclease VII small subunit [Firmicutes bacterium]|nr:exodeoxyribonuclease VII small subunit [Bacillota bacterium]
MDKKEDKLNFEEAMKELENIVQQLEKGELNLDDSMKKFEEGVNLSKKCSKYLENAEKKISILVRQEDGTVSEENFN